jgi:hypothetical protein
LRVRRIGKERRLVVTRFYWMLMFRDDDERAPSITGLYPWARHGMESGVCLPYWAGFDFIFKPALYQPPSFFTLDTVIRPRVRTGSLPTEGSVL